VDRHRNNALHRCLVPALIFGPEISLEFFEAPVSQLWSALADQNTLGENIVFTLLITPTRQFLSAVLLYLDSFDFSGIFKKSEE
jgi:hypothetical protein